MGCGSSKSSASDPKKSSTTNKPRAGNGGGREGARQGSRSSQSSQSSSSGSGSRSRSSSSASIPPGRRDKGKEEVSDEDQEEDRRRRPRDGRADRSGGRRGKDRRGSKSRRRSKSPLPRVRGGGGGGGGGGGPPRMPALPGRLGKGGPKSRRGSDTAVNIKRVTKAIMNDNLTEVQKVLNGGASVDALYSCQSITNSTLAFEGATLLHLAVFLGKFNIAKFLLIKNADLNVRCDRISDSKSRFHLVNAFQMVVALCGVDMIDLFLRSGARLDETCDEYVTYKYFYYANVSVFHLACFRKDANEVIDLLLTKAQDYPGVLELMGGEIRPHNEKHSTDKTLVNLSAANAKNIFRDVTCLHIAVALNRKYLVKALMKHGSHVDAICGEVSFKYELSRRNRDLANANRSPDQEEITHGLHSYKDKTVTQLAFLTERTSLIPLLKAWKK